MPRTVLVIDDDADLLTAHAYFLERAGYRVVTAADGEAGLEAAFREKPSLILLDLLMPRMNGFLVLERLSERFGDSVPVVMMTANGDEAHRRYAACIGAADYLEKPVSVEQILKTVTNLCPLEVAGV